MELTTEEQNAIRTLKRLAKRWPDSLWLLAGDGSFLHVMRTDEKGRRIMADGYAPGYSQEHIVASIEISNDGGGW